jgi:hypothetical protein
VARNQRTSTLSTLTFGPLNVAAPPCLRVARRPACLVQSEDRRCRSSRRNSRDFICPEMSACVSEASCLLRCSKATSASRVASTEPIERGLSECCSHRSRPAKARTERRRHHAPTGFRQEHVSPHRSSRPTPTTSQAHFHLRSTCQAKPFRLRSANSSLPRMFPLKASWPASPIP